MESISERIAQYVQDFGFKEISEQALQALKYLIVDTLGCAVNGSSSPSASITRGLFQELGASRESTILGSGSRTSCLGAALSNGVALRFSEYMDYLAIPVGNSVQVFHQSETIPAALALAEKEGLSGEELVTAILLGYELSGRMCASVGSKTLSARGWHHATLGYFVMPLVAGKLLELTSEQLANAVGISACNAILGIIDAEGEEYRMVKNIAFPLSAQTGIMAAILAKKGFTGVQNIFEGENGFISSVLENNADPKRLLIDGSWVFEARLKPYPVAGAGLGIASATVDLVRKYGIRAKDVDRILVKANKRTVNHLGDPTKKYPKNKETADHSAPFLVAVAVLEGDLLPQHFADETYSDKRILALIDKIDLQILPELDDPKMYPAAEVEVKTKQGATYTNRSLYHKGHPRNRMSDKEVEEKFLRNTRNVIGEDKARELIDAVYQIDKIENVSELAPLFGPG